MINNPNIPLGDQEKYAKSYKKIFPSPKGIKKDIKQDKKVEEQRIKR